MKYIQKQQPPPKSLADFIKWVKRNLRTLSIQTGEEQWARYKKTRHRITLQDTLIEEQGYICAYCNRRIHRGTPENDEQLRVDHIQPKIGIPDPISITFNYYNLVGCCYGDEKESSRTNPPHSPHCDVSKKNVPIPQSIFPTNITCEQLLLYSAEGEIFAPDAILQDVINNTLNLNCEKLTILRKNAILPFLDIDILPDEADKLIRNYITPNSQNQLAPFCGAIIGYLRQNYNSTL